MNNITYYDVCAECDSSEIVIESVEDKTGLLDLWCRNCGASWSDYIEDIQREYYGS
jgi:transcription elongation factor Elf1